jgi:hypothetical protein
VSSVPSDAGAPLRRPRLRRRAIGTLVVLGLLLAATAVGLFLSLRFFYVPLGDSGTGYGPGPATLDAVIVRPVAGSGGKPVVAASKKTPGYFTVAFDLANSAPFTVKVAGLSDRPADWREERLLMGNPSTHPRQDLFFPFEPFELAPGDQRMIGVQTVVRDKDVCRRGEGTSYWDTVRLRFSYLGIFDREATIEMPVAASLYCTALPPGDRVSGPIHR